MKAPAAAAIVLLLATTASLSAATRTMQSAGGLDAEVLSSSHQRQLLAQKGMRSAKALLGLDRNNKQLRVLAHGDSITEGWINTLWVKTPWTPKLQQQLQQKLGGDWRVDVLNGGELSVVQAIQSTDWPVCGKQRKCLVTASLNEKLLLLSARQWLACAVGQVRSTSTVPRPIWCELLLLLLLLHLSCCVQAWAEPVFWMP